MTVPLAQKRDRRIAFGLGAAYVVFVYLTASTLGYARDEGFYFQSAQAYRRWFELLLVDPASALERESVERFWAVNSEHPSLMKVLFMASEWLFHDRLGWISEPGTAYRLPGMLMAGLAVALIALWGSRAISRPAGIVAALSFALMPRIFYHAHLACFDVPVAAMWLVASYVYFRSLETKQRRWLIASGVVYGLLLETKHNSWLLPAALIAHLLLMHLGEVVSGRGLKYFVFPRALIAMATIGPLVFYALWPWLWFDPIGHFIGYFEFHRQHEYYNMEFLGRTYWKPPMPLGYAWLMTVATVPLMTLLLALLGLFASFGLGRSERGAEAAKPLGPELAGVGSTHLFWILGILVAYAPWWSRQTPIFGGTKHWITAYPFLCLLAGRGFELVIKNLGAILEQRQLAKRSLAPVAGAAMLLGPLVMTLRSHPFGLTFYTPVVGGASGAATLGLNRTFWGYTTGSLVPFINEHAPRAARIYVHDTALQSFDMMQSDGTLRSDLKGTLAIHDSNLALYHHEPHMGRVEYQIWVDYGTTVPSEFATYEGVPVAWIYERPAPAKRAAEPAK